MAITFDSLRRAARSAGIIGMPPVTPVEPVPSVNAGTARSVDMYIGKKSVNPLGLQSFAENRQMRGLLKSNMSATRHRTSMAIINNI